MTDSIAQTLRATSMLGGLTEADLETLAAGGAETDLAPGEVLFKEGDLGTSAYLILEGSLEILKRAEGSEIHLADRGAGEVIGEIALMLDEPRSATVRATEPTRLLMIARGQLEAIIETSTEAARALFLVMLERWRNTESKLRHSARMAQLGTLSAGLAHELNNPAAAMESLASRLPAALRKRDAALDVYEASDVPDVGRDRVSALLSRERSGRVVLRGLDRSDREDQVERLLTSLGVADASDRAWSVAELGMTDLDLAELAEGLNGDQCSSSLGYLCAERELEDLFDELRLGARRVSDIVDGVKRYSYLDQAPVQEVNVVESVEDTIGILGPMLDGVELVKQYAEDVPSIQANGRELTQVWTELLDNAVDAAGDRDPARIIVRISGERSGVRVEVEDNGPGVAEEHRQRLFDPFFTTKNPGSGPGLGLHTAHSIIAERHGGSLRLGDSDAGACFVVTLPEKRDG